MIPAQIAKSEEGGMISENDPIKHGDYVLATKYDDGDPGDNWGVGFYDREENGRHFVVDSEGRQLRAGGFRRAGHITEEYGAWLLSVAEALESSPPGTVNLWNMATPLARVGTEGE